MSADGALAKVTVNFLHLFSVVYVVVAKVVCFVRQLFTQEADVLPPVRQVARVPFVGYQVPINVSESHVVLDSVLAELFNGRVLLENIAWQFLEAKLAARTQAHIAANDYVMPVFQRIDKQRACFQQFGRVLNALFERVVTLVLYPSRVFGQSCKLPLVQLQ